MRLYSSAQLVSSSKPWFSTGNGAIDQCSYRPVLYSSGSMGYLVLEPGHCPWTDDADLNARGGVVVWDYEQLGDTAIEYLRSRFPRAELQPPVVLPAHTRAKLWPRDRRRATWQPYRNETH